jgi:hypothetical protein
MVLERRLGRAQGSQRSRSNTYRQYILALTGSLPRKRDWGSYIDVLQQSGADASAVAVLDNIRTLERNPLMHPEDWLDVDDAVGIFNISTTAVVRLAEGIKKHQKTNVTSP